MKPSNQDKINDLAIKAKPKKVKIGSESTMMTRILISDATLAENLISYSK